MNKKQWKYRGDPVEPNAMVFRVRNYNTPRIFKSDGRWVAVNSIVYTEYSKGFVPIAEAETLEELNKKLKPSWLKRCKQIILRLIGGNGI